MSSHGGWQPSANLVHEDFACPMHWRLSVNLAATLYFQDSVPRFPFSGMACWVLRDFIDGVSKTLNQYRTEAPLRSGGPSFVWAVCEDSANPSSGGQSRTFGCECLMLGAGRRCRVRGLLLKTESWQCGPRAFQVALSRLLWSSGQLSMHFSKG